MIAERPDAGEDDGGSGARRANTPAPYLLGIAVWAGLLVAARLWAELVPHGPMPLDAVWPFVGWPRILGPAHWLLPAAVGAVLVAVLPDLTRRLRWRPLLFVSWLGAGTWSVSLAATTGLAGVVKPLLTRHEYVHTLPAIDSGALTFLRTFVEQLSTYPTHTRGHPPAPVLVLYGLQQLGLPVVPAEAALVIVAGASAVAAVAVTVRVVAGEGAARRCLPFLVLAPMALWIATSMDAFFLGVSAWGLALLALATERQGRRAIALSVGAGLLLGSGLYLSYGLAPFGLLPLALLAARRCWWLLIPSGLGVAAVVAAFTAAGFWWVAGMQATHAEWMTSIGPERPYYYFLLANIAVLGFMVGPAAAAAIGGLRDTRIWWLVAATLLAVAFGDVLGVERGEVERIWLPFAMWLIPATAVLRGSPRWWLGANVVLAVAFQGLIHSPW